MLDISIYDLPRSTFRRDPRNPRNPQCAECLETPVMAHRAPMHPGVFHVPSAKFYENGCIYVVALAGTTASCSCPHGQNVKRGMSAQCWHVGRALQLAEDRDRDAHPAYVVVWQTPYELFEEDEAVEPPRVRPTLKDLFDYQLAS